MERKYLLDEIRNKKIAIQLESQEDAQIINNIFKTQLSGYGFE